MSAAGGTHSAIFQRYSRLHLGDTDSGPRRRAPGFKIRPHGPQHLNTGDTLNLTAQLLGTNDTLTCFKFKFEFNIELDLEMILEFIDL